MLQRYGNIICNCKGGVGNYRYSLFDEINTPGLQSSNQFKTGAGNFKAIVEDSNHCSVTTNTFEVKAISCDTGSATATLSIQAYPNPAISEFNLDIKSSAAVQLAITVTDALGNRVYYYKGKNLETYRFGRNFAGGIYFVRVMYHKEVKTIRLYKAGQ